MQLSQKCLLQNNVFFCYLIEEFACRRVVVRNAKKAFTFHSR